MKAANDTVDEDEPDNQQTVNKDKDEDEDKDEETISEEEEIEFGVLLRLLITFLSQISCAKSMTDGEI
jgi:hypothetical protein